MSEKKFQRFGKYLILDHLVDGGMAKICRARYLGEQANKVVAIKMVQPQFSNDEAFVRMFQDELNITFGMLHPNIMQVYDYGKVNNQLYTAMEYIHGANLKQYLDRLKDRKVVFPVEISCYIISQVCLGLHYAHTFTDKLTGKPYNIVHRDISPHNIMLTYDGAVKVIDFGIAKANTNSEATQAGTIKGKLSYLAPEYLDGLELDARYDEFAVGITLWEMLCSRKLFQANNDLAVLKQIQACKIVPPSQINPSVPKELDTIVMKALSKDRTHRYENLDQMNRALIKFLYSTYPEFNASDLQVFANELFKDEISKDKDKFVDYGKIDVQPYINEMKNEESRTGKINKKDIGGQNKAPVEERMKVREIELAFDNNSKIEIDKKVERSSTLKHSRTALNKVPDPKALKSGTGVNGKRPDKTTSKVLSKKELAKQQSSSKSGPLILVLTASIVAFAYFQSDLVEELTGFNLKKMIEGEDVNASRDISSVPGRHKNRKNSTEKIAEGVMGKIVLSNYDVNTEVYVDNRKINYLGSIAVPFDKEVEIEVRRPGHTGYSTKVTLTKADESKVVAIPDLVKNKIGILSTSQNYTAGSKLIYEEGGKVIERNLPFNDVPITEGMYEARVVNPSLGTEKKVQFTIEENKKHFLE